MITPDDCTSSQCKPPKKHCPDCSHACFYVELDIPGRFRKFEFNPYGGVYFVGKSGRRNSTTSGRSKQLYESEQEYIDLQDKFAICRFIGASFTYGINRPGLSLEQLRKIKEIIEVNHENI